MYTAIDAFGFEHDIVHGVLMILFQAIICQELKGILDENRYIYTYRTPEV
jgi:hypothetical protein